MQVIYVSNCFSDVANKKIHDLMKGYLGNAPQKFHRLIIDGMANNGANIHAVSFVPINIPTGSFDYTVNFSQTLSYSMIFLGLSFLTICAITVFLIIKRRFS